ncbi:MAG: transcriptional regulator [Cyanobacteria bacterium J06621_12]
MPLTIDSEAITGSRIQRDKKVAQSLYNKAVTRFLNGDTATSRLLLRDLVNATIGFEQLAQETSKPSKSLHRMLSANGNPTMDNLALIFKIVGEQLKIGLEV